MKIERLVTAEGVIALQSEPKYRMKTPRSKRCTSVRKEKAVPYSIQLSLFFAPVAKK